ncbi:MAG TPA: uroporphyrinogen-III synthase [Terriglobales bacterium]|jgi:uroporphyrinogen-III synthase|nr:uroporphyrinogen-III synthase [Terriglobales bacterium]
MTGKGFEGLRVLALESRRAREMAQLITNFGGRATVAPSTREVPSGPNPEEAAFAAGLAKDEFQLVIFMTGVGTRALARAIEAVCPREHFVAGLRRTAVVARGPKPVNVLREFGIPIALTVPEPNTWREILLTLDQNVATIPLQGARVAVQEHGVPSPELYAGLSQRGALVFAIPVYKWAPPEDEGPLRQAIAELAGGEFGVVLFTSSVQAHHLFRFADEMNKRDQVLQALRRTVVGSIGPVTSETLREFGIGVDLEPSHPKMGFLVKETAEQSGQLLERKKRPA